MADVLGRLKACTEELTEVAQMLNLLAVDVTKAKAEGRAPQMNPRLFALRPQPHPDMEDPRCGHQSTRDLGCGRQQRMDFGCGRPSTLDSMICHRID